MSEATLNGTEYTYSFVSTMLPLLKEYTVKLNQLIEQCNRVRSHKPYSWLMRGSRETELVLSEQRSQIQLQIKYLIPPAEKLARAVSGMIANGRLNEFERIESEIRLAEFEALLLSLLQYRDPNHRSPMQKI